MRRFPYDAPGIPGGSELQDIRTLGRLVADLARYAGGGGPTPEGLSAGPLIAKPSAIVDASAWRLAGLVCGHPNVGPGPAMTSRIYAIDPGRHWARRYSRLWRIAGASPTVDGRRGSSRGRPH